MATNVFISWSGENSLTVANAFADWLPSVLQNVKPYISSEDIQKGERWSTNLASTLATYEFGIIVVTPDNLEAPWIMFEAGSLSKNLEQSRVIPVLCGVEHSSIVGNPLSQFQYATLAKEDILRLCRSINYALEDGAMADDRMRKSFEKWWTDFEAVTKAVDFAKGKSRRPRKDDAASLEKIEVLLEEVLARTARSEGRGLRRDVDLLVRENSNLRRQLESASMASVVAPELRTQAERIKDLAEKAAHRYPEADELREIWYVARKLVGYGNRVIHSIPNERTTN